MSVPDVSDCFHALRVELEKIWPDNRAITWVFHGHSVPAGYHKTPEVKPFESYPHLVHKLVKSHFPHAVLNVMVTAVGGETSPTGALRFENDVLIHHPDLVFIDYALNDRRVPEEDAEKALTAMLQAARSRTIPVLLITPTGAGDVSYENPEDPLVRRAALIRSIGRRTGTPVADVFEKWSDFVIGGGDQETLLSQINHPNLAGHQLASKVIASTVLSLLGQESRLIQTGDPQLISG
jgi:lysophospholipase L1-like esterase